MNSTSSPFSSAGNRQSVQDLPRFDAQGALHRLDGDEELLRTLYTAFMLDVPIRLERLATALETQEYSALQRHAHALKGSAAIIGAPRCEQLAGVVERLATAQAGNLQDAWAALREETRCVLQELAALQPAANRQAD